jgi:hypothetical protein
VNSAHWWSGHDGAAAHCRHCWSTFDVTVRRRPDQHSVWSSDAEVTWHGRHIGRFLDIEPTGRTIAQPFA